MAYASNSGSTYVGSDHVVRSGTDSNATASNTINLDSIQSMMNSTSQQYSGLYQSAIDAITSGYDQAQAAIDAQSAAGLAAINQTYSNAAANATQGLVNSGLSSGTVAATTAAGIEGQKTAAQQQYSADLANKKASLLMNKANALAGTYGSWAQTSNQQSGGYVSSGNKNKNNNNGYNDNSGYGYSATSPDEANFNSGYGDLSSGLSYSQYINNQNQAINQF